MPGTLFRHLLYALPVIFNLAQKELAIHGCPVAMCMQLNVNTNGCQPAHFVLGRDRHDLVEVPFRD